MQACTRGCDKTINTDFKRNNTPFVLNISQRSSEGRIDQPTRPDQIHVGQNTATLSQAVPAWLRPVSNIISHTLFQLSMNRVLWNRLLFTSTALDSVFVSAAPDSTSFTAFDSVSSLSPLAELTIKSLNVHLVGPQLGEYRDKKHTVASLITLIYQKQELQ